MFINRSEPVSSQPQAAYQALQWNVDVVPGGVVLLLPVEQQMMTEALRHDDLCEKPRCGDAALLQGVERRNDGSLVRSNSRNSSSRRFGGMRTRPRLSVFKIIDEVSINVVAHLPRRL